MCRIAGFYDLRAGRANSMEETLRNMRDCMAYGGPDNAGEFIEQEHNLALGHRRLSILDVSEAGNQPFYWNDLVLIQNGECYNFKDVRQELAPYYKFNTGTDTEVMIKAFEKWGLDAINKFRGMFAISLWNKKTLELILIRDRVGVKPLYYYMKDGLFLFSSELKAFHQHPDFDKTIDQSAVSLYLQQGYIQAPKSIFKYVHKVLPGEILILKPNGDIINKRYWSAEDVYSNSSINTSKEESLTEELEEILSDSFNLRMVSDVPVGMFLSGGVDSSLVTSLIQKKTNSQVKTFTIGFNDKDYNEAEHANAVARHIGSDHTEMYCGEDEFLKIVPKIPEMLDEPMGDSSIIPTHIVAKLAKEKVKVSLSADGGDEIFGGYTKYEITKNFFPKMARIPKSVRRALATSSRMLDPYWLEKNADKFPFLKNYKNISAKLPKLQNAMEATSILDFFNISSSYIAQKDLQRLHNHNTPRSKTSIKNTDDRLLSYLGTLDITSYLEGDILTKVDRATMQVALEGRDPLLDHKIIEFAMQLPDELKLNGNTSKYLLRKILYKYVPKNLIDRPKQGFSIPVKKWLQNHLKDDIDEIRNDNEFVELFELDKAELKNIITNFNNDKAQINAHFVWFLYTLNKWYLRWLAN